MRSQVVTTTLVIVFALVTMASAEEFRPVGEIPLPETGIANPMTEKVEFITSITPDDGNGSGFVAALAGPLHSFPCPVVIWAAPDVQLKDLVRIPDDKEDADKEMDRFFWQIEKRTKDLHASGLIGTSTGDKIQEDILNDLKANKEKIEKDIDNEESKSSAGEIVSSTRTNENCQESFTKTWTDAFDTIQRQSSPYLVYQHKGFTEIAWGSKETIETHRRNMSKEVPPIALIATSPEQFLPMWQAVSGMELNYEVSLLKHLQPQEIKKEDDLPDSVVEDSFKQEIEEERKEYQGSEVFEVTHTASIQEFMENLALTMVGTAWQENGKWFVGECKDEQKLAKMVKDLLYELKKDPYEHGFGTAEERLKMIGLPALPYVLKEFETADLYYLNSLTVVLSTMDAPERDAAFLNKLRIGSATGDQFLENWYASSMMHTLAHRGVREVIPIIQKYATQNRRSNIDARICLNILDAPLPAADPASLLIIGSTQEEEFKKSDLAEAKEILYAAIDQCWDGTKPIRLCEIKRERKGVVSFGGPLSENGGTWEFRVGKPKKEKVSVSSTWYGGPAAAEGKEGIAELRNGRWLFIEWWMNWIS